MTRLLLFFGQYVNSIELKCNFFSFILPFFIFLVYFIDVHYCLIIPYLLDVRIMWQQDGTGLLNCVDPSSPRYGSNF